MRALVVYESMYGNTHAVADRIGAGLASAFEVTVVPVWAASAEAVAGADLLVVGGPTHVHGMSSSFSRRAAREAAAKPGSGLSMDAADADGLREWLEEVGPGGGRQAAAFDTRVKGPATLTGHASSGIARRLRRRGFRVVAAPESFLVDKENRLLSGELGRAEGWGTALGGRAATAATQVS